MPPSPYPHATITITSSAICFGTLPNIHLGSFQPIQPFPGASSRPRASGTVKTQPIEYNVAARNGTWNIFRLMNTPTNSVCAWFASHSSIDPQLEVTRIIRVSGSPYEPDSGSTFNNDKTAAEGVFVINRYDWGWYSQQSQDLDEVEEAPGSRFEAAGLVDRDSAQNAVNHWKTHPSHSRECSTAGAWLHIPDGEYMFARFGFDDPRKEAVSFLFFTTNTQFTETVFEGVESVTLRKEETPDERFNRRLAEGYDFSGLEELNDMARLPEESDMQAWAMRFTPSPPPEGDRLGPYEPSMHIFRAEEIDAIGSYQNDSTASRPAVEFVEGIWAERVYDLINEMVLSYLEGKVYPLTGSERDAAAMAEILFPRHAEEGAGVQPLDTLCYRHFMHSDAPPLPSSKSTFVKDRIASFLSHVGGGDYLALDDWCIAGMTRALAYIFDEVLEMSHSYALDCHGTKERVMVMPSDIRMVIYREKEFRDLFQFSRVFWEGRDGASTGSTG